MTSGVTSAFVHPSAVVDDDVVLGEGTRVWHFVHVSRGARIGRNCVLGQNVFVGANVRLGDGVKVQNNVSIYDGVEVEDDVFLGPSCVLTNVLEPRAFIEKKAEFQPTRIRRGASIGANATVLCGHELGAYSLVGAGSVVLTGTRDYEMVVGNPARFIGWACRCGVRLGSHVSEHASEPAGERVCGACALRYSVDADGCQPIM